MKENLNLRDKNGVCFCKEQWDAALRAEFRKLGISLDCYLGTFAEPKCRIYADGQTVYITTPNPIREWIENNPKPDIEHAELIVLLAHRVERLEAALAEKGGSR